MEPKNRLFRLEVAGSLAPDLEGAPVSRQHTVRGDSRRKEPSHAPKKREKAPDHGIRDGQV